MRLSLETGCLLKLISLYFLVILIVVSCCNAKAVSTVEIDTDEGVAHIKEELTFGDLGFNMTDYLDRGLIYGKPEFQEARRLIETTQVMSSCHSAATNELLNFCEHVTADNYPDVGQMIDRTISLYGVRVAICETGEGGAPVPLPCRSIVNVSTSMAYRPGTDFRKRRHERVLEIVTSRELGQCVRALLKEPIYWISYSNNRQQAATMCQAVHWHVDREELVQFYSQLVDVTENLNHAMHDIGTHAANEHTAQRLRAEELSRLHQQQREAVEEYHQASRHQLTQLMTELGDRAQEVDSKFRSSFENVHGEFDEMKKILQDSIVESLMLKDAVARTYETAASGISELSAGQLRELQLVRDVAVLVRQDVQSLDLYTLFENYHLLDVGIRKSVQDFSVIQSAQMENAFEQFRLSDGALRNQRAMDTIINQTMDKASDLQEKIDVATQLMNQFTFAIRLALWIPMFVWSHWDEIALEMFVVAIVFGAARLVFGKHIACKVVVCCILVRTAWRELLRRAAILTSFGYSLSTSMGAGFDFVQVVLLERLRHIAAGVGIFITIFVIWYMIADYRRRYDAAIIAAQRDANRKFLLNLAAATPPPVRQHKNDRFRRAATAPPVRPTMAQRYAI